MPTTSLTQALSPIGSIKSSMLTLAQFQTQNGTGWVLADGTSCVGTSYATITGFTTLPDLRGVALRGKNNGRVDGNQNPDGDVALGTFQSHSNASHNHGGLTGGHTHQWGTPRNDIQVGGSSSAINGGVDGSTRTSASAAASISSDGGNESRMRNVTVNHFIRVN